MKIGLVCPYSLWRGGGVQECVIALHKELTERGHDVKILAPQPYNQTDKAEKYIITLGLSTDIKATSTTSDLSVSIEPEKIEKVLAKENFDILHFHEPWVPFLSRQILSRSDSVNVATFHAKLPETTVIKTFERVIVPYVKSIQKYVDGITAVSPAAAEYVSRVSSGRKITIVPNGIDLDIYKPSKPRKISKYKTILYIGRLEKRKGVVYLLKAFNELLSEQPDVRLLIAGDGPDREKLEEWVANHEVPNVNFLGYVSEEEKYQLLNNADLFCSPALYGESFGIVLLEAMAMGVVTVAGNNPGYSSVLKARGRISLISPKDTKAFMHKLELLLNDQEIRMSWKNWAKTYVKNFDYKKVVDQYEAFYEKALKTQTKKVLQ